ncbi:hypothetical protein HF851_04655 [Corynebacterium ammoniagenes]|nr:hypothetical protein [Corynebacterium ammoniagenes]NMF31563.1 hypothetical protein [Corynebacterium ammoniagenes]
MNQLIVHKTHVVIAGADELDTVTSAIDLRVGTDPVVRSFLLSEVLFPLPTFEVRCGWL